MSESQNQLYYRKTGKGRINLLLFHGFGQNHTAFDEWLNELEPQFTIYAFDLYYHGNSTRPDQPLEHARWIHTFEAVLAKESIDQYQIIAFSLGGRFALSIARFSQFKPTGLILIAPDGFIRRSYYRIGTSQLFNPLFKYLMTHPRHFEWLVNTLSSLRITNYSIVRFANAVLLNPENRLRVYRTWTYFDPLQLPRKEIFKLETLPFTINLILGAKDSIISDPKISHYYGHMPNMKTHRLEARHHHMITSSKSLVASLLEASNL